MASTNFTNNSTVIDAAWLDDVDVATYSALSSIAGTNTITATGPVPLSAYASGQMFRFIPAGTNTGATTLNITPSGSSALGAKNVFFCGAACVGGEIVQNVPCLVMYDGTQFNIMGPTPPGEWTAYVPTVSAEAGTWGSPTVTLARYRKIGKTLHIALRITASVATGSPTELRVLLPNSLTGAAVAQYLPSPHVIDNGTPSAGLGIVSASGTYIAFLLVNSASWNGAGATSVTFTGSFEVA